VLNRIVEISFLALIFSLAFMQPQWGGAGPAMTLTEPLFLLTTVALLIVIVARKATLHFDPVYIFLGLYAAALGLSAFFSEDQRYSFLRLLGEFYLIGLAVLTINIVRTQELLKKVVLVWLAASAVSAIIGSLAVLFFYLGVTNFITDIAFHNYGTLPPGNYIRIQSTFLYPAMLCNYLTVSFMMLLAASRLGWVGTRTFVFLLVIFTITAAFTFTPGLGGLLLAVAVWIWLLLKENGRAAIAKLSLATGVLAALVFQAISALTPIPLATSPYFFNIAGVRIDPTPRLLVWSDALKTFLAHPLFGKGVGEQVAAVTFRPPDGMMQMATDAHNVALSVAAQSGILGLIALCLIVVAVVRRAMPFSLEGAGALKTALGIGFVSAFIVQGMVGSFEDARHLWVLIGLIASPAWQDERKAKS
jgi:O-antigen ligase